MSWINPSALPNPILIKEPFTEKYTLTIETDIMAGNLPIKSKSELRWEARATNVGENSIEMEINTLDNRMLECNNPMVKDLAAMSQTFGRMYNEVRVRLDNKGKIIHVLNLEQIKNKWSGIKAEMEALKQGNPAVENVISLNDSLFTSPDKMRVAIENNEFFLICFQHYYGLEPPVQTAVYKRRTLLNTADLEWRYKLEYPYGQYGDTPEIKIGVDGMKLTSTSGGWAKEAYKHFSHLPLDKLVPTFMEKGNYIIERKSGKLLAAELVKKETVHPQLLHATIKYRMESDSLLAMEKEKEAKRKATPPPLQKPTGQSVIFD